MRRHPASRTVGYAYHGDFDERAVEAVLAAAKARGVVHEYDTGRGTDVWFNGPPGAALREVRRRVEACLR